MSEKIVAIIQARMGSQRLPGKVTQDILGKPMLQRVVERVSGSVRVDQIVIATTIDVADDPLEALGKALDVAVVRGHPHDVLDRYMRAARMYQADIIVRLTADCPLLDAKVVDATIEALLEAEPRADLAVNRIPGDRTFPIGLDTEVCRFEALDRAWQEADQPYQREHVLPYLYEEPGRFHVVHYRYKEDCGDLRWTVDTPEDLEVVRAVYAAFAPREDFGWLEVLDYMRQHPGIAAMNAGIRHKGFKDVDERMEQVGMEERE